MVINGEREKMSEDVWKLYQLCEPVIKFASQNLADDEIITISKTQMQVFKSVVSTIPQSNDETSFFKN